METIYPGGLNKKVQLEITRMLLEYDIRWKRYDYNNQNEENSSNIVV